MFDFLARWIVWPLVLWAWLFAAPGCVTNLDRRQYDVNQKFREGNRAFAAVAKTYQAAARDTAAKKHALQATHLERDWADFVRIHTNAEGRLVSRAADGTEKPLLAADLTKAIAARETKQAQLMASRASWAAIDEPFGEVLTRFQVMTETTAETEAEIMAAKESAQQLVDSALGVASGLFAGVAGTMMVAP